MRKKIDQGAGIYLITKAPDYGGHCQVCVGYDRDTFIIWNPWYSKTYIVSKNQFLTSWKEGGAKWSVSEIDSVSKLTDYSVQYFPMVKDIVVYDTTSKASDFSNISKSNLRRPFYDLMQNGDKEQFSYICDKVSMNNSSNHHMYLGYTLTTNPNEAVSNILIKTGNKTDTFGQNPPNTFYDNNHEYTLRSPDLNKGEGGKYIWLYETHAQLDNENNRLTDVGLLVAHGAEQVDFTGNVWHSGIKNVQTDSCPYLHWNLKNGWTALNGSTLLSYKGVNSFDMNNDEINLNEGTNSYEKIYLLIKKEKPYKP